MQANAFLAPFNHAYAAIDSETYRLLSTSTFLKEISHVEVRTTTDGKDQTWSGIYILGSSTYFELLRDDSLGGLRPDFSGFAVSPEREDAISECIRRLGDTGSDISYRAVRRREPPVSVPWFYMATPEHFPEKGEFQFWCMQYHPHFLREWKSEILPTEGISRRNVLDKYRSHLALKGQPELSDIIALSFNLEPTQQASLTTYLLALGWRKSGDSGLEGPEGFIIQLPPEGPGRHGLRAVTFRTEKKTSSPQRLEMGAVTLTLLESSAILEW